MFFVQWILCTGRRFIEFEPSSLLVRACLIFFACSLCSAAIAESKDEALVQHAMDGFLSALSVTDDIRLVIGIDATDHVTDSKYGLVQEYIANDARGRGTNYSSVQQYSKGEPLSYWVTDGINALTFTGPSNDYRSEVGVATRGRTKFSPRQQPNYIWQLFGTMDGGFLSLPKLIDQERQAEEGAIEAVLDEDTGQIKISGPIVINNFPYEATYWVDLKKSGIPVRMEMKGIKDNLRHSYEVVSLTQLQSGAWFPEKVKITYAQEVDGKIVPNSVTEYSVLELEEDPEYDPDIVFDTSWTQVPEGAFFLDANTEVSFIVGEGPVSSRRIHEILDEALAEISEQKPGAVEKFISPPANSSISALDSGGFGSGQVHEDGGAGYLPYVAGGAILFVSLIIVVMVKKKRISIRNH